MSTNKKQTTQANYLISESHFLLHIGEEIIYKG